MTAQETQHLHSLAIAQPSTAEFCTSLLPKIIEIVDQWEILGRLFYYWATPLPSYFIGRLLSVLCP